MICHKCEIGKVPAAFHRRSDSRSGYHSICKECKRAYDRVHGKRSGRASAAARHAQWKRYKLRYPEKVAAQEAVRRAVRSGRLTREPCVVCAEANVQGHHSDYRKKLDVVWLCQKHHNSTHRQAA